MDEAVETELRELHARVCKAIADPKRLLIINLLRDGELSVGDICEELRVSQSNASQHLAMLRERDIVTSRRSGTTVYYALRSDKILQAIDLMREFVAETGPARPAPGTDAAPDARTGRVTGVFLG
jgi:DNA-binding transcriptional ArsR family regulator